MARRTISSRCTTNWGISTTFAYRKQPSFSGNGANDGFHEAIGDAIALSITPEYLKKIGLIENIPPPEADLPLLLRTALDKVAFLPFGLMIDKWRWEVFSGQVKPGRLQQSLVAIARAVSVDFACCRSIALRRISIRGRNTTFPGTSPTCGTFKCIYQFQFYRAMCRAAGYAGPLNRCSVFGSKAAGDKLESMLELGQSKPWPEAMKRITGEDRIDASAMPVEYFQPLLDWLKEQNKGEKTGWTVAANPMTAR